tara:strand:- start:8 stop:355 length:348 start_codon:yes stop_codon:yes gene_type:complete
MIECKCKEGEVSEKDYTYDSKSTALGSIMAGISKVEDYFISINDNYINFDSGEKIQISIAGKVVKIECEDTHRYLLNDNNYRRLVFEDLIGVRPELYDMEGNLVIVKEYHYSKNG